MEWNEHMTTSLGPTAKFVQLATQQRNANEIERERFTDVGAEVRFDHLDAVQQKSPGNRAQLATDKKEGAAHRLDHSVIHCRLKTSQTTQLIVSLTNPQNDGRLKERDGDLLTAAQSPTTAGSRTPASGSCTSHT
jgi:hypothetical protein